MDNVFEELQKYIDKRVEEAVDAKIEELKAYLLNPASMTLKEFLLRLGVGATKWGHGLECTLFAVEYCHNNNIRLTIKIKQGIMIFLKESCVLQKK